jgi:hypothetical protein
MTPPPVPNQVPLSLLVFLLELNFNRASSLKPCMPFLTIVHKVVV